MALIWFLIGIVGTGSIWGISAWRKKTQTNLSWRSWVGILLALSLGLFTLAWCLSSIWENEFQAAGVGFLIFGSLSLTIMGFTRKSVRRDRRLAQKK